MRDWILPGLATFFFWGLWGFIPKITTRYITPQSAIIYEALGGLPVALVVLLFMRFRLEVHPRGMILGLLTGVIGFLGALSYLLAVSRGKVSLVVSFTALYPAFSVLLAVLMLHETLTLRQGLGVAMALIAMVLVAA